MSKRHKTNFWAYAWILIAVTLAVFHPVLKADFLNWDDPLYLVQNETVHELSFSNLHKIFFGAHEALYKPLVLLSYVIEHHFFGLNPMVYHATNLALHILNVLLVFVVTKKIIKGSELAPFLTAIFFAIHPMRVESVAWVTERKDMLFTFFYFLALLLYLKHHAKRGSKPSVGALACFVASVLSKPAAVTLPAVLTWIEIREGLSWRAALKKTAPYWWVAIVFATLTLGIHVFFVEKIEDLPQFSLWSRVGLSSFAVVFYLWKFIWPLNLSIYYDFALQGLGFWPLAGLVIVAGFILLRRFYRSVTYLGAVIFVLTLSPMLYPTYMTLIADRFTYVPYWGLFLILAQIIAQAYKQTDSKIRGMAIVTVCVIAMSWSALGYARTSVFQNSVSLWTDCLRQFPLSERAYNNRGMAYSRLGEIDRAIADFEKAISINPISETAWYNRGVEEMFKGDPQKSILFINKAINLTPNKEVAEGYFGRGNAYHAKKDYPKAIEDYTKALSLQQNYPEVLFNRANDYKLIGELERARADFDAAIAAKPRYAEAYNNRGVLRFELGDAEGAAQDYAEAIRLRPRYAEAYNNRAILLQRWEHFEEALADSDKAIRFKKDYVEAYNTRGITHSWKGNHLAALQDFTMALRLKPDYTEAYYNRGNVYAGLSRYKEALADFTKTAELDPSLIRAIRKRDDLQRLLVANAARSEVFRRE